MKKMIFWLSLLNLCHSSINALETKEDKILALEERIALLEDYNLSTIKLRERIAESFEQVSFYLKVGIGVWTIIVAILSVYTGYRIKKMSDAAITSMVEHELASRSVQPNPMPLVTNF